MSNQGDWTIIKLLKWTRGFFEKKGIEEARLDAEILLSHCLDMTRVQLYTHFNQPVSPQDLAAYKGLIKRRADHEPVAYITGTREFWSMELAVNKHVLIPRPDTETLVEATRARARKLAGEPIHQPTDEISGLDPVYEKLQRSEQDIERMNGQEPPSYDDEAMQDVDLREPEPEPEPEPQAEQEPWKPERPLRILDLGTGSGAIALALAKELPYAHIVASDISAEALEVARANAQTHGLSDRITFVEGDLLEPHLGGEPFDVIVSNPPYIADGEKPDLDLEVSQHEPGVALFSGPTGLEIYERIVADAAKLIRPGGYVLCEIGHTQGPSVRQCFEDDAQKRYTEVRIIRDRFSSQNRVVEARVNL